MGLLGNLIWLLCGGLLSAIAWLFAGLLWCITVIGIPYGLQCFKFAKLSLAPFGKRVEYGGGAISFLANVIWIIFFGIPMTLGHLILAALFCITIVGIPFGKQFFKLAKLSLMPFGARII